MPEGHVIHRLARDLTTAFVGRELVISSPQGRFPAEQLADRPLVAATAVGKHLFLDFGPDAVIHIHLGLIGKFRPGGPEILNPETLRLRLASESQAFDLRGPQWCRLLTADEAAAVVEALGPDPLRLDADPDRGWEIVRRSGREIGELLLDQRAAAGVGNIYRAEVLFRQRVSPSAPGKGLSKPLWDAIWADLVGLMADGVETGRIDTIRPEHAPEVMGRPPRVDAHGGEVYVYRRAGAPCLVCGHPVRVTVVGGRNRYWCANCQQRTSRPVSSGSQVG